MKINVEGEKAVIKATRGDIVYFDESYWLIGTGIFDYGLDQLGKNGITTATPYFERCFYLIPLITSDCNKNNKDVIELKDINTYGDLQKWLSEKQAVVYDGKLSNINLVYKQPE